MSDRATIRKTYVAYEVCTRKRLEDDIAKLDREIGRLTARRDRYVRLLAQMPAQEGTE